jgi:TRAP-type C4-dicarboxylate transport system permease small subunit
MTAPGHTPLGQRPPIEKLAAFSAFLAGAILVVVGGLSVISIVSRSLGFDPIMGDFEMVQVGMAVCVALFLPWCHLRGGNIIVDFFTARASARTRGRLDAIGSALFAVIMIVVAWRTGAGALVLMGTGETTMLLGFPVWISYVGMIPGFLLTAAVALHAARRSWQEGARG